VAAAVVVLDDLLVDELLPQAVRSSAVRSAASAGIEALFMVIG
jgi:hypothetical protein